MGFDAAKSITMTVAAAVAQHRFVKLTTAAKIIQAAAVGDDAVGVSLEGRTALQITAGDIVIPVASLDGAILTVESGAAIDVSAGVVALTSDATGRAIAVAAATDRVLGYAMQSATAAGQKIDMLGLKGGSHRDA